MQPLRLESGGVPSVSGPASRLAATSGASGPGFKDVVKRYLEQVNELQLSADTAVRDVATGKSDNLHGLILAINEADLSFRLMMEMRNRLVEAYKEIMRMQV